MTEHDRFAHETALMNGVHEMLRASERVSPSASRFDQEKTAMGWDLKLDDPQRAFTIKAAKNDRFRVSHDVEVYATDAEWCPAAMARRHMERRTAPMDSPLFTLDDGSCMTQKLH